MNTEPRLLIMELDKPWYQTTTSKMISASAGAVIVVCKDL